MDAPVLTNATAGEGQVTLSWGSVVGANGYTVKYGIETGVYDTEVDVGNVLTYAVTGLDVGIEYFFVVMARADILTLHMEGADASTTFTNSSPTSHTVTASGNAQIDTAQFNVGAASGLFDGNGDYLTVTNNLSEFNFQNNFVLSTRVRFNQLPDNTAFTYPFFVFTQSTSYATDFISFIIEKTGGTSLPFLAELSYKDGVGALTGDTVSWTLPTLAINTWYKIKWVHSGDTLAFYLDDVLVTNSDLPYDTLNGLSGGFGETPLISKIAGANNGYLNGWLDEYLIYSFGDDSNELSQTPTAPIEVTCGIVGVVTSEVTNLDHLEGQEVAILADGEVLDRQVVQNGKIILEDSYAKIHVGLPFESDFETINIELGLKDGTTQGRKVKIGNVMFRVIDSRGGWIGPNQDRIYEAFPSAIVNKIGGENLALMYSGDIRMPLGAGYEDGGRVFYRQKDPLPITISAVVPEVSIGGSV